MNPRNPDYYDIVENGASIGPEGTNWTGSFGSYMQDRETNRIFGITCAHNICKYHDYNEKNRDSGELVELLDTGSTILQPSPADLKRLLQHFDEFISSAKERPRYLQAKCDLGFSASHMPAITRRVSEIQNLKNQYQELSQKDKVCENHRYGELKIENGELLDYILLEIVSPERQGTRHCPF